ncbi:hypothetical protein GOBAR_AA00290 [Gossypium barbadense]|uniref:Uncharacterized protein n=1 Tax=Gossypium barbadense TaxID=3634 RepID=A0A2P5YXE0_GOSBA|nr:hypothetical protein GOBAR_AA00290 [Gossypium barbadense]
MVNTYRVHRSGRESRCSTYVVGGRLLGVVYVVGGGPQDKSWQRYMEVTGTVQERSLTLGVGREPTRWETRFLNLDLDPRTPIVVSRPSTELDRKRVQCDRFSSKIEQWHSGGGLFGSRDSLLFRRKSENERVFSSGSSRGWTLVPLEMEKMATHASRRPMPVYRTSLPSNRLVMEQVKGAGRRFAVSVGYCWGHGRECGTPLLDELGGLAMLVSLTSLGMSNNTASVSNVYNTDPVVLLYIHIPLRWSKVASDRSINYFSGLVYIYRSRLDLMSSDVFAKESSLNGAEKWFTGTPVSGQKLGAVDWLVVCSISKSRAPRLDSVNPDAGKLVYPVKREICENRLRVGFARRSVSLLLVGSSHYDREEYQKPEINFGLRVGNAAVPLKLRFSESVRLSAGGVDPVVEKTAVFRLCNLEISRGSNEGLNNFSFWFYITVLGLELGTWETKGNTAVEEQGDFTAGEPVMWVEKNTGRKLA